MNLKHHGLLIKLDFSLLQIFLKIEDYRAKKKFFECLMSVNLWNTFWDYSQLMIENQSLGCCMNISWEKNKMFINLL